MKYRKQRPKYGHSPRIILSIRLGSAVHHFTIGKPKDAPTETDERLHVS